MKRVLSLVLVIVLCMALSVSAFAAYSDQGGITSSCDCCDDCTGAYPCPCGCTDCKYGPSSSPKTGSLVLTALAITACTAGGISVLAGRKAK